MSFRKDFRADGGSVLMEPLLTIPLFIAFFSGIFVLGDLELGRNRLTAADRCALWLRGCRFADMDDEAAKNQVSSAFFKDGAFADGTAVSGFKSRKNTARWYALFRGTAELKMELPVWASGTRRGVIAILAADELDQDMWDEPAFKARETGNEPTHSVLMRVAYDGREKSPQELSGSWYTEYSTPCLTREGGLSDVPGSPGNFRTAENYIRYSPFETWSL